MRKCPTDSKKRKAVIVQKPSPHRRALFSNLAWPGTYQRENDNLQSLERIHKKGAEKCPGRYDALASPWSYVAMLHVLSPRPVPAGRGPLFYLQPGRSPEHQTKERQQRQEHKASHAANLPYP